MNKKTKLVLDLLEPKAQSLGFTKKELEGIAENIANNLGLDDDATDEALNAAASKAVDAQMFYLELGQTSANRIIQKEKEKREKAEAEAKKKAEEEAAAKAEEERKAKEEAERKAKEEAERKKAEEEGYKKFLDSEWAKNLKAENENLAKLLKEQQEASKKVNDDFEAFRSEFNQMKADKKKADREKELNSILVGTGVFGERIKKNYAKMSFESDEEFNDFVAGIQEDIKAYNQERADQGLDKLGNPGSSGQEEPGKVEPMSDAEVDALAAIM